MISYPENDAQVIEVVRGARAEHRALGIFGAGTRTARDPDDDSASVSSCQIRGIVDYEPAEMVMTVKSGTPVAEVEAALAANRQMMAFEPMDHRGIMATSGEPTIGGVFAANVSGPRRFTAGAARDSLLGIRFVNGQGQVIRAGGRVMKNVTGLDLVKLLAGSQGTLGFITEVTFRVLPVPPAIETIVISGLDDLAATKAMAAAMALSVEVSGAAHLPASVIGRFLNGDLPKGEATVMRLEGLAASVSVRAAKLAETMEAFGPVSRLGAYESCVLWREIRDVHPFADGSKRPLWRVSVAPSVGHQLVAALRLEACIDAFFDWQGGLVWMRMEADPKAELLRRHIRAIGGGHATLVRATDEVRALTPAFEPLPDGVAALSARVKQKLDPAGIFSPGKMG
ncbi:glycolate oxidase FAD binding subunit [Neorhizobium sp. R1-B]|uniref:FAD-binding protein n=1 Tax=Neorhizobium sp. R1-B TaxID=2485162 RepID=UPI001066933C|nr:FAD-binding protein [Neorhizobium sp. R1-B]TDX70379.1 glycolate oxidase FAD binding subunit [Neorhizobium sp. R1-B]